MPAEVIDTNVLCVASALESSATVQTPVKDPTVLRRVHEWVVAFRNDRNRRLVMDVPEQTIRTEYQRNLPNESYGRRVFIHKFTTGAVEYVPLTYWRNGSEFVANLPDPSYDRNFHDLGDRNLVASAHGSGAPIVNAADSDWTEPDVQAGLNALGVRVVQLLTDDERRALRTRP